MINSLFIGKIVNDKLKGLVDNKCFPLIAENSTTFPFIIYSRDSITSNFSKDGIYEDSVIVSVKVVGDTYNQSIEIANDVRTELTLHNYTKYSMNVNSSLISASESYESNAYVQTLVFEININN